MIRLSKILLFFTATVLLAWILPWACDFLIGAKPRTIRQQFLFESIIISQLGGVLGIHLGVNLVNALVLGVLGVPGFGLLLLLNWALAGG